MPLNNPTPAAIAFVSSTYAGNNSGAERTITTGFACKLVVIVDPAGKTCLSANTSTAMSTDAGVSSHNAYGRLDPTNGFIVGSAANKFNANGVTYTYVALG